MPKCPDCKQEIDHVRVYVKQEEIYNIFFEDEDRGWMDKETVEGSETSAQICCPNCQHPLENWYGANNKTSLTQATENAITALFSNSAEYNPGDAEYGFTREDWLTQNGLCPKCESPETKDEYESGEDGEIKKCAQCGHWLGKGGLSDE